MPSNTESLIAFTPYLCTEAQFSDASKTAGDFFFCRDSGQAYVATGDNQVKPFYGASRVITATISRGSTSTVAVNIGQNINDVLCIVALANEDNITVANNAQISATVNRHQNTQLDIKAKSGPTQNIELNIFIFFNHTLTQA